MIGSCLLFISLVDNDRAVVVCVGGVAPILEELVADTVTVLNEYVGASATVAGELAVLDDVAVADVEQTDRAAYVVSLVAFEGAVGDAGFEVGITMLHAGVEEDRGCLIVRVIVLEGRAVYGKVFSPNCAARAFL